MSEPFAAIERAIENLVPTDLPLLDEARAELEAARKLLAFCETGQWEARMSDLRERLAELTETHIRSLPYKVLTDDVATVVAGNIRHFADKVVVPLFQAEIAALVRKAAEFFERMKYNIEVLESVYPERTDGRTWNEAMKFAAEFCNKMLTPPMQSALAEFEAKVRAPLEAIIREQDGARLQHIQQLETALAEAQKLMPCGHPKACWSDGPMDDDAPPPFPPPGYCTVCKQLAALQGALRECNESLQWAVKALENTNSSVDAWLKHVAREPHAKAKKAIASATALLEGK